VVTLGGSRISGRFRGPQWMGVRSYFVSSGQQIAALCIIAGEQIYDGLA